VGADWQSEWHSHEFCVPDNANKLTVDVWDNICQHRSACKLD